MSQNYRSRSSIAESQKRNGTLVLESTAKRRKLESYINVCNDGGDYDVLSFGKQDCVDCLYTSNMQLPSLFNLSDEDEDMTFRLMKERRSRFSNNSQDDEKSQFYK